MPLLTEPQALDFVEELGLAVPARQLVRRVEDLDLDALPGERLVVKAVVPGLVHKTEAGAVAIVPRDRVGAAMEAMAGLHPEAFLVLEFVAHDAEPGAELLLSLRWTREHGPVVALGLGGVTAEALGQRLSVSCPDLPVQLPPALMALLTGRTRGRSGRCRPEDVETLVQGLLAQAGRLPRPLLEVEMNPVVRSGGRWVALDAVVRLGDETLPTRPPVDLGALLRPRSMGIVGASARGENPGRAILQASLAAGFPAEAITVVKAGLDSLDGCRCVPTLAELEPVDLLVLAVPGAAVAGIWTEALRKAAHVLLIPGGTGERAGTEGLAQELTRGLLAHRAAGGRARVIGGNSLGLRSVPGRVDTLFVPARRVGAAPRTGPLAIVSSSGALALSLQSALPLAPAFVFTLGNQLDLSITDVVRGLADEPEAQVIALYIEGLPEGEGQGLVRAVRTLCAQGRRVIVYRAGRTPAGQAATASHTAAMGGDAATSQDLLRQAGARVVDSLDALVDQISIGLLRPAGNRLAVMSNAGFECVAAADHLGRLRLATLAPETLAELDLLLAGAGLGGLVAAHNPLDLTPIAGDAAFVAAARRLLQDPGVDLAVLGCVPFTQAMSTLPGEGDALVEGLEVLQREATVPFVLVIEGGALYDPLRARLREAGLVVFGRMDRAVRALGG